MTKANPKKPKRQIKVVNIPEVKTLIDLGDAHAAVLIVLANVEVPEAAHPFVQKARYILAETFKNIVAQYESATGETFSISNVEKAFTAVDEVPNA